MTSSSSQVSSGPPGDVLFQQIAEASPQLIWTTRADGHHDYFNPRWYEYTGMNPGDNDGEGWRLAFHAEDLPEASKRWAHSLRTGDPYEVEYRCRRHDGVYRWFLGRAQPVRDAAGRIVKWLGTCTDIDDQKRAADSMHFLAEASALLSSSLDYETTLQALTRLAVPRLADWCSLDVVMEDGSLRLLAVAHVDPAKVEYAWELRRRYPPGKKDPQGMYHVLRTGRSELLPDIPDEMLVAGARDAEHLRIARELGLSSALLVPLKARGRTLGVLQLVSAESKRSFREEDVPFAEQLATRAALAVDNARLYRESQESLRRAEEEQRVSETLRRVGMTLASELEPARLIQVVTDAAMTLTGAAFGAFFEKRADEQGERYVLAALSGAPRERVTSLPAPTFPAEGPVLVADVTRHADFGKNALLGMLPAHLAVRGYLAVPIKSRSGEVLGGLFFGHPEAGRFLPMHARLAEGVAAQASVALDNARLYSQAVRAEERFRLLVSSTSQAVWAAPPDGLVEEDSPSWRTFTGQSYEDYRGFGWLAVVHPEDQERVRRGWEAARGLKRPYEVEMRVRRADGTWAITLWRAVPLLDAQGGVREWIGTSLDITAQRLAEESSRRLESEQRTRQLESLRVRVNDILSREDTPGALMQGCAEAMTRVIPALALVQLWSFGREAAALKLEGSAGLAVPPALQPQRLALGEGFAGGVGQTRQAVLLNDVRHYPQARAREWMEMQGLKPVRGHSDARARGARGRARRLWPDADGGGDPDHAGHGGRLGGPGPGAPPRRGVSPGACAGPGALQRGAGAVRLRRLARPAGAAAHGGELHPAAGAALQGQARRGRRRVHRLRGRRGQPHAAAHPRPARVLARGHAGPRVQAHRRPGRAGPGAEQPQGDAWTRRARRVIQGALPQVMADETQLAQLFQNLSATRSSSAASTPPQRAGGGRAPGARLALLRGGQRHRHRAAVLRADLRHLPAAARARSTRAPASGWRSARRSSSATAAASGSSPSPARAPRSASPCPPFPPSPHQDRAHEQHPRQSDRDPAGRGQPRRRAPDQEALQGGQGAATACPSRATAWRRWPSSAARARMPRRRGPDLILLDLNLPQEGRARGAGGDQGGHELRRIPVVVLTTSKAEEDILRTYELHANCYITKPVDLEQFISVVRSIDDFWLTVVRLPSGA